MIPRRKLSKLVLDNDSLRLTLKKSISIPTPVTINIKQKITTPESEENLSKKNQIKFTQRNPTREKIDIFEEEKFESKIFIKLQAKIKSLKQKNSDLKHLIALQENEIQALKLKPSPRSHKNLKSSINKNQSLDKKKSFVENISNEEHPENTERLEYRILRNYFPIKGDFSMLHISLSLNGNYFEKKDDIICLRNSDSNPGDIFLLSFFYFNLFIKTENIF